MLPVTLASADANDSSEVREGACLPQSFSVIVCLSFEAIDMTAAFARCVMSRNEVPTLFAAGLTSADCGAGGGGGTASASCAGARSFVFGASASLGAASGGVSGDGAALAAFDATLCRSDAENRSLNMSGVRAATVSGFPISENTSLTASVALRVAITCGSLT